MIKKNEKKKFLLKCAIDEHYSWIKAYNMVIAQANITYEEQFDINVFMNNILDMVSFENKSNLSMAWVTKIIQDNTKNRRWKKEFIEEWRKQKKEIQEVERIGDKIFKEIEKSEPTDLEEEPNHEVEIKVKSFSCDEKIMKFLNAQKHFKIRREEKEKISVFLSQKTKLFMRSILHSVINYSQISNRKLKSETSGDEFKYFSKDSPHIHSL